MRFFIPFTLILATIALATALNADNMVDENKLTVEEAARCLRGYQKCLESCRRHHGGQRCYNVRDLAP
ncbi:uncharacterized protein BDW43DRAFT_309170 [Aspergillus alliaceus]|uniref:uncharacterized protein n=1 Tax=Petromyces alliaceus TaxID=209559 RepID=UPI0012A41EB7|nr:uncharacterized protein BDW43DRAFT_309170 [Aspergillus alliaceus]KAB8235841.1 hypothetical protein BDW43DRAFT_309170 [Aspergillus alliaceus]